MDADSVLKWINFCQFELYSISTCFIRVAVTDYAHLTEVVVIDPCSLLVRKSKLKSRVLSSREGHRTQGFL